MTGTGTALSGAMIAALTKMSRTGRHFAVSGKGATYAALVRRGLANKAWHYGSRSYVITPAGRLALSNGGPND